MHDCHVYFVYCFVYYVNSYEHDDLSISWLKFPSCSAEQNIDKSFPIEFQFGLDITMAAIPNPFAIPRSDHVPNVGTLRRHGSAEQVNRDEGGTYLTAINTPR